MFCRCRPPNKKEITTGCATVVDFSGAKEGELGVLTSGSTKKTFKFDRVFTPNDDQGIVRYTLQQKSFCMLFKYIRNLVVGSS